jgi:hypothetical protein
MNRKLLCPACGQDYNLHPEDEKDGFKLRKVHITAKKPDVLNVEVISGRQHTVIPVPFLVCDLCNTKIEDGSPAVATTMWQGEEPESWEKEYSA